MKQISQKVNSYTTSYFTPVRVPSAICALPLCSALTNFFRVLLTFDPLLVPLSSLYNESFIFHWGAEWILCLFSSLTSAVYRVCYSPLLLRLAGYSRRVSLFFGRVAQWLCTYSLMRPGQRFTTRLATNRWSWLTRASGILKIDSMLILAKLKLF